jgi:hypothetical protein
MPLLSHTAQLSGRNLWTAAAEDEDYDGGERGGWLKLSTKLSTRFLALSLVGLSAGCGNSVPRTLQAVSASPAVADAKNFPNGRVQFVPIGIYNKPPITVTPLPITAWSASPSTVATIGQNGIAQCAPGQVGIVKILVALPGDGPLMNVAQLTCP